MLKWSSAQNTNTTLLWEKKVIDPAWSHRWQSRIKVLQTGDDKILYSTFKALTIHPFFSNHPKTSHHLPEKRRLEEMQRDVKLARGVIAKPYKVHFHSMGTVYRHIFACWEGLKPLLFHTFHSEKANLFPSEACKWNHLISCPPCPC